MLIDALRYCPVAHGEIGSLKKRIEPLAPYARAFFRGGLEAAQAQLNQRESQSPPFDKDKVWRAWLVGVAAGDIYHSSSRRIDEITIVSPPADPTLDREVDLLFTTNAQDILSQVGEILTSQVDISFATSLSSPNSLRQQLYTELDKQQFPKPKQDNDELEYETSRNVLKNGVKVEVSLLKDLLFGIKRKWRETHGRSPSKHELLREIYQAYFTEVNPETSMERREILAYGRLAFAEDDRANIYGFNDTVMSLERGYHADEKIHQQILAATIQRETQGEIITRTGCPGKMRLEALDTPLEGPRENPIYQIYMKVLHLLEAA